MPFSGSPLSPMTICSAAQVVSYTVDRTGLRVRSISILLAMVALGDFRSVFLCSHCPPHCSLPQPKRTKENIEEKIRHQIWPHTYCLKVFFSFRFIFCFLLSILDSLFFFCLLPAHLLSTIFHNQCTHRNASLILR